MIGDELSADSAKSDFTAFQERVDKYEERLGIEEILGQINIKNMSPPECGEKAAELAAYAIYLQRILNKERTYLKWLADQINLSVAQHLKDCDGYYSSEQRRSLILRSHDYPMELEKIRINVQAKVEILENLPFQINQLYRALIEKAKSWRAADQH